MSKFDVKTAREHFPALKEDQVYFDNAGGSQILGDVVDSISSYLRTNNVQLGASYRIGQTSSNLYVAGYSAGAKYINARPSEVVIGSATTQLFRNLSLALKFEPGDELVLSNLDHEANVASWVYIAEIEKLTVKWWPVDKESTSPKLTPEALKEVMSEKTRLVACTHASNILGTIHDVKGMADVVHGYPRALFCVDGVAYAPHRRIDVKALDVDFYCFSWYKVYGPHVAQLYASEKAQKEMRSLGHYFNPSTTLENKLALAGANYELTQAIPTVTEYLTREGLSEGIIEHEGALQKILLDYLNSKPDITVWGEKTSDPDVRVPTVSFTVKGKSSTAIVEAIEAKSNYGLRNGHMYSHRLVTTILNGGKGLSEEGVIRCSMVHYNTEEEIEGFVKVLDEVLRA